MQAAASQHLCIAAHYAARQRIVWSTGQEAAAYILTPPLKGAYATNILTFAFADEPSVVQLLQSAAERQGCTMLVLEDYDLQVVPLAQVYRSNNARVSSLEIQAQDTHTLDA